MALCAVGPWLTAGEAEHAALAERLRVAIAAAQPAGATVTRDGAEVVLALRLRRWLVYNADKRGVWAAEPAPETGPDSDGLNVRVRVAEPGHLDGAAWDGWHRRLEWNDDAAAHLRRPYWTTFGCVGRTAAGDAEVLITVDYNNRSDRALIKALIAAVAQAAGAKPLPPR